VQDDARRFLRTSADSHDVIIGDVFHPDQVGRSALLSVQQFERARARLAPQGLFVQWLALNQFDLEALQLILRSFVRVFPDACLFMDGFRVALVGGMGALDPASRLEGILQRPAEELESQSGGEGLWTWLGRYWGAVPADDGGAVQDEWRPHIEFHLPQARYRNGLEFDRVLAWLLERRPAPEDAAAMLGVSATDREEMERAYIAADLALRAWLAGLQGDVARSNRLVRFAFEANPRDRWVGFSLADSMLAALEQMEREGSGHGIDRAQALEAVLSVRPDHADTLRALWRMAREAGDEPRMRHYLERLAALAPFDKDVTEFNALIDEGR
jgi:spermidine synthase